MRVYPAAFAGEDYRPLTAFTNRQLGEHLRNFSEGRVEVTYNSVEDVSEQIRIILFAREMGWL